MAVMALIVFLSVILFFLYRWAFVHLPEAGWQMLAAVPVSSADGREWKGVNFTFYGLFNGLSYAAATAVAVFLCGTVGVSGIFLLAVIGILLGVCIPASSLVARFVEKKSYTLSIGGAVFVGTLLAPWIVWAGEKFFENGGGVIPVLAAIGVAYALGEGMGRLACISFGCCYGRPISSLSPRWREKLGGFGLVFRGETKKASYAGGFEGVALIPVQAVTTVLYSVCALLGMAMFLYGFFVAALLISMLTTQLWRFFSEFLRSDYRGRGRISTYQGMSLVCAGYALALPFFFPSSSGTFPEILPGLSVLWTPETILLLQAVGLFTFWFTGRSDVTASSLRFHVLRDRI
ncbi:MAG: prolipoprotein diacylglyceryl transferase family protein [Thermodesulfobacteriota bacterium]